MKKSMIFLMLILFGLQLRAQRMVYKQKSIEVSAGMIGKGSIQKNFYLSAGLNSFARRGNYWMLSAEYQKKTGRYKSWEIPIETYLGEAGFSLQLLSDRKKFITLNAGLTGVAGYESINNGDSILMDGGVLKDKNQFVFGTGARLSLETYLSDRIVFLIQGRMKVLWRTDLDQLRPTAGAGIKFNF